MFLTADTLQTQLDQLQTEGENMGRTEDPRPDSPSMEVKVTEMNERKLMLQIRVSFLAFLCFFSFLKSLSVALG